MKIAKPSVGGRLAVRESLRELVSESRREECDVLDCLIRGVSAAGEEFAETPFEHVILENCRFSGCDFTHCDFTDTVFRECDFSNCRFAECGFRRCEFHSVKGLGADFTRSRFRDAAAIGCNFEYANFHGAIFDRALFRRCNLGDAAFTECTLKALLPDDSELIRVNFFKTPLKGVDFTSCRLQAPTLSLGGPELRGAEVTLLQAAELAGQMGVIIKG